MSINMPWYVSNESSWTNTSIWLVLFHFWHTLMSLWLDLLLAELLFISCEFEFELHTSSQTHFNIVELHCMKLSFLPNIHNVHPTCWLPIRASNGVSLVGLFFCKYGSRIDIKDDFLLVLEIPLQLLIRWPSNHSYLHNEISFTCKITSLYWIETLPICSTYVIVALYPMWCHHIGRCYDVSPLCLFSC